MSRSFAPDGRVPHRFLIVLLLLAAAGVAAAERPPVHALATAHPLATEAGLGVLREGGNAFDAAVAVAATLAVVEPYASGLGGGGFFLLQRGDEERAICLDARERAPLAAHRDLYRDPAGRLTPQRAVDGALAAGIPGLPAALDQLARRYATLPLKRLLADAIRHAREGFAVDAHYARLAHFRQASLAQSAAARVQFLADGAPPAPGARLVQRDLADTLAALATRGHEGFYAGMVADRLVEGVRAAGGVWTRADLAQYRVIERAPVTGTWAGYHIRSAPPPSAGGVTLIETLNILGDGLPVTPASRVHRITESWRRAFRDRAEFLGDPDFIDIPLARLIDPAYGRSLGATIDADRATPSRALPPAIAPSQGPHTTHFSILDAHGNRVAATLSINYPFGSGFVPPGTGVLLNDEMDDFSIAPGQPNLYGLVGGEANAIASGKRMLSSMAPTFVDGPRGMAILGTPGGSRIPTMLTLAVIAFAEGADAAQIVAQGRFHHQYLPDRLEHEPGSWPDEVALDLAAMGHELAPQAESWGNMQAITWERATGQVVAASDRRGEGGSQKLPFP